MGGDRSPESDGDLAFLKRSARRAAVRMALAGGFLIVGGVALVLTGRYLESLQAGSDIQFTLPTFMQVSGVAVAILGAVLAAAVLVGVLRTRRS